MGTCSDWGARVMPENTEFTRKLQPGTPGNKWHHTACLLEVRGGHTD